MTRIMPFPEKLYKIKTYGIIDATHSAPQNLKSSVPKNVPSARLGFYLNVNNNCNFLINGFVFCEYYDRYIAYNMY